MERLDFLEFLVLANDHSALTMGKANKATARDPSTGHNSQAQVVRINRKSEDLQIWATQLS